MVFILKYVCPDGTIDHIATAYDEQKALTLLAFALVSVKTLPVGSKVELSYEPDSVDTSLMIQRKGA